MKYLLSIQPMDMTQPTCIASLNLPGTDLKAEEYLTMQRAKELYRDAMHQRGLWPLPGERKL